ncbi:MAG: carbohydrate-binding protein, partial [Candidatus Cryptobacteroides sp.]
MTTEQITTTVLKADEGKVLRRKSSGAIYGETVHLGYNYYDAGVGLSEAHLDTPDDFEEIDKPEDYEAFRIDQVKRLNRITELVAAEKAGINNLELTDKESLEVIDWFPIWEAGKELAEGEKVAYDGSLWRVRQAHTSQEGWEPSTSTAALFEHIEVEATGTIDDPIAYVPPMEIFSGKYYTQGGVLYL